MEGSNVGQNLQSNLCNFHYFRFRAFISSFLGTFNAFKVKFGSLLWLGINYDLF